VRSGGAGILNEINENPATFAGADAALDQAIAAKPPKGDFGSYSRWNATGDLDQLDMLHAAAIQAKLRHMYMLTEGHWWTDRVEQPSDILQRERLGGIALARGQTYPGHTVSWRFDHDEDAERVALLLPGATHDHFKVIGYNLSGAPVAATMSTWNVAAGRWHMTRQVEGAAPEETELDLERSASTRVNFAPGTTTTYEFRLVRGGTAPEARPDIGIGSDDVRVTGRTIRVTVHSLGSKDAPAGVATVESAQGDVLGRASIGPMRAPQDLMPRTQVVNVTLRSAVPAGARVRIRLADGIPEVTQLNNVVLLDRTEQGERKGAVRE
jgi:hypothetical protein